MHSDHYLNILLYERNYYNIIYESTYLGNKIIEVHFLYLLYHQRADNQGIKLKYRCITIFFNMV